MNILIVDDSSTIRGAIKKLLLLIDNVKIVSECSSVKEAIEFLTGQTPDLIILDLKLLDGNGFEVLKYLKEKSTKTTTLVLSNFAIKEIKERALELGADFFFDKSTEFEEALSEIKKLASG